MSELKIIGLKVKAGARANSIGDYVEIDGKKYLKLNIKSIPEKGRANGEIISFLSEEWKIPKQNLRITSGHRSKLKVLEIMIES